MISFLSEVFSDNSDIARLITVAVSTFIAILTVRLNHHLTQKRERDALRLEKLERLYESFSQFSDASYSYLHEKYQETHISGEKTSTETFSNYSNSHQEALMLAEIYEKGLTKNIATIENMILLSPPKDIDAFLHTLGEHIHTSNQGKEMIIDRIRKITQPASSRWKNKLKKAFPSNNK